MLFVGKTIYIMVFDIHFLKSSTLCIQVRLYQDVIYGSILC